LHEPHISYFRFHWPDIDYIEFPKDRHVGHKPIESTAHVDVALRLSFVNPTSDKHVLVEIGTRYIARLIRPIAEDRKNSGDDSSLTFPFPQVAQKVREAPG
jgi:hypothetical protein